MTKQTQQNEHTIEKKENNKYTNKKKQDVVENSIVVVIELDVGHFLKGVK